MNEDAVREDIAFIRRTIEQGRQVAITWGPDLLVWGLAVAIGYFGTYARIRGLWRVDTAWLWTACIVLPWLYSLWRVLRRLVVGQWDAAAPPSMTLALKMLWLACGIFLTILGFAVIFTGEPSGWWMNVVPAGVIGIGFFVSSFLCDLAWMRWVAVVGWAGELALFALRARPESLLLAGALMLVLLAVPGLALMRRRPAQADA
jgi:hypothetical protein